MAARDGGTAQRSRKLLRAAGILGRQIVAGEKKGEKGKGKAKKLRKVKKEKKEKYKKKYRKETQLTGLGLVSL